MMNQLSYHVYILQSLKDRELYVGLTTNVDGRMKKHEQGEVQSTAPRRPFRLLLVESYVSKQDAARREVYLKSTAGRRALKLMLMETLAR